MYESPTIPLPSGFDFERQLREINEALLVSSVSQHELVEQAQKAELRYRRLFETANDGILILDGVDAKIIDANPAVLEIFGITHDKLLGKQLWQIGLFKDRSATAAALHKLHTQGYARYDNLPLTTSEARQAEVEVVATIYDEGDQSVIQCNIRDITDRSRLERQLQQQAVVLADLHRRKDEFLAMLSHELRNPLASIANAVHLLRLQNDEDLVQHQARTIIERQVGQLKHLIDDLLEISRISTGRIQLRQERIAVGGIVERAIETTRPLLTQLNHELEVSLPPQPIWIFADAARLEQVLVNLLNNAAKYTVEGGRIWLTVQQEGQAAIVQVRVRDSGIGIAPELLPQIFDLFTQAERSLDRSQGGLGIGLALVQRLVELHGGTVTVSSVLGQGSEFIVRLPTVLIAVPAAAIPQPAQSNVPKLRILVVDDNVDAADSLTLLLIASGHDVRTAYNGLAALEMASEYLPEVMLLDIGLPGLNGYEVAERVRQQPALKNVLLIAMTGYGQESDRERSRAAGFDRHLVKPVPIAKLCELLNVAVPTAK